jgi:hypothetical protein
MASLLHPDRGERSCLYQKFPCDGSLVSGLFAGKQVELFGRFGLRVLALK